MVEWTSNGSGRMKDNIGSCLLGGVDTNLLVSPSPQPPSPLWRLTPCSILQQPRCRERGTSLTLSHSFLCVSFTPFLSERLACWVEVVSISTFGRSPLILAKPCDLALAKLFNCLRDDKPNNSRRKLSVITVCSADRGRCFTHGDIQLCFGIWRVTLRTSVQGSIVRRNRMQWLSNLINPYFIHNET